MTARLLCTVFLVLLGCRKASDAGASLSARLPDPAAAPGVSAPAPAVAPPAATGQLARVRPPPAPCLAKKGAKVAALLERAGALAERGDHARALSCAEEALRAAPRSVPALHQRASALAALKRPDEARRAFARALAVDPDDPETLLGAADFYVTGSKGDREALLVGLEYALRGARRAAGDDELAAQLLLVAVMAENDLGDSRAALAHADEALRARPRDATLHYERGVALYELVRFEDARLALEQALALRPDDAWALHQLALVAEHEGQRDQAAKLHAQARARASRDFGGVEIPRAEFEAEVRRAIAALPEEERRALATLPLEIADVPSLDDLTAVDPPLSPTILGLYRGPPEQEACEADLEEPCRSVVLYWRNLARFARDRQELAEQVRVTLLHELGHFHGETDDELRDRGLE